jgi:O-antigen/teichoic acid export membrane protein
MEILFWLVFIVIGALWMKNNGLSWVEGALWGGFLTFLGLIVIFFRIRSSKKNPKPLSDSQVNKTSEIVIEDKEQISSILRQQATKQILYGLAWWSGSAVAIYFALQSTGTAIYWFGGALGALFHWYRAFKIFEIAKKSKLPMFLKADYILMGFTLIVVLTSSSKIVPEYFRIDVPTIGTCWAQSKDNKYAPVACWSAEAKYKTVRLADSEEACGSSLYFEPSANESRFTCLEERNVGQSNT